MFVSSLTLHEDKNNEMALSGSACLQLLFSSQVLVPSRLIYRNKGILFQKLDVLILWGFDVSLEKVQ